MISWIHTFIWHPTLRLFSNLEYLGTLAILFEFFYSDSIGNQRGESPNHSLLIHLQLGKEVGKKKFRFDRAAHRRTKNFLNSYLNFHVPRGGLTLESFIISKKKCTNHCPETYPPKENTPNPWLTLLLILGKSRVNQKSL